MRRFQSMSQTQPFLSVHVSIQALFRVGRHHLRAIRRRILRSGALVEWRESTCACGADISLELSGAQGRAWANNLRAPASDRLKAPEGIVDYPHAATRWKNGTGSRTCSCKLFATLLKQGEVCPNSPGVRN